MLTEKQMRAALSSPLLCGLSTEETAELLKELRAFPVFAARGEMLIEQGQAKSPIHIVLSGAAVGERLSPDGGRTIINEFSPGSIFGDMLSGGEEKSPVAVRMTEDGEVLRIAFSDLLTMGGGAARARETVLRNLFGEISQKYFSLMRRVNLLLCPSLRGKIAIYLLNQAEGRREFLSSHSRQEQAEMLCCDRSALSRELSRLRSEGVIDFHGRSFEILDSGRLNSYATGM